MCLCLWSLPLFENRLDDQRVCGRSFGKVKILTFRDNSYPNWRVDGRSAHGKCVTRPHLLITHQTSPVNQWNRKDEKKEWTAIVTKTFAVQISSPVTFWPTHAPTLRLISHTSNFTTVHVERQGIICILAFVSLSLSGLYIDFQTFIFNSFVQTNP